MIFKGKIIDVDRRIERGFNMGTAKILGLDTFKDTTLKIDF